ncbi:MULTISPECIES: sugar ABC transporter substrate-binding protein [Clostridium]|uniref:Sugar ABC transporter substrate-binding protein n=1 Tax=Clostridium frigoriphilum TaxID=443253 RepID=A0ABU7UMX8_9CLOT|nr:sugar ABC transporter substrate-binding protein [Clostridium sp. DSM 17811]MBU3100247.1 sugar ABC transporter substrate-binding protein [Clostridium sp. DSM 17811]
MLEIKRKSLRKLFKRSLAVVTVLTMSLGVVACGNTDSGASKQKTIAFIPPSLVSPFYASSVEGAKAEATKEGYTLKVLAPQTEDDFNGLLKIVEDVVTQKVDGISICTTDNKTMAAVVKTANAAKIPVVVFNSLSPIEGADVYSYVGYDQKNAGAQAAEYLGTKLKGKQVNVGILEGLPGVFTDNRKGGFVDEAKKYSNIKIVATQPANWEREKGMNVATNMYQANKTINVFYGLSDEMAIGATQAFKSVGIKDGITIGIDGNPATMDSISKGETTATVYTSPKEIGTQSIVDCGKAIKGLKVQNKMHQIKTLVVDKSLVSKYIK